MSHKNIQDFSGLTAELGSGGRGDAYGTGGDGGGVGNSNKGVDQTFSRANLKTGDGGDGTTTLGHWQNNLSGTQWAPDSNLGGTGGTGGSIGSNNSDTAQNFGGARLTSGAGGLGSSGKGGAGGSIGSNNA
ncbi:hypothetical protein D9757_005836 [Collybiopsis confluens]|uniref:Uncharacterized protein n=1 Tax=Collybiopsis confluens TaxID=2823264 RepID=A0A8H5MAH7_9AGAR|nr:hypothetical protein D9757_005836 [Collybiopsis confluens]